MKAQWSPRAPRFRTSALLDLQLPAERAPRTCVVDNLSVSGLLARARLPLEPGSSHRVRLRLDAHVVECEVRVSRVHAASRPGGGATVQDLGLRFTCLGNAARRELVAAISELAQQARQIDGLACDPARDASSGWQTEVPGVNAGTTFITHRSACVVAIAEDERHALWRRSLAQGEVFVVTARPPAVGAEVIVSLATSQGGIELRGQVVDVVSRAQASDTGHPPGISLSLRLDAALRRAVRALMLAPG